MSDEPRDLIRLIDSRHGLTRGQYEKVIAYLRGPEVAGALRLKAAVDAATESFNGVRLPGMDYLFFQAPSFLARLRAVADGEPA